MNNDKLIVMHTRQGLYFFILISLATATFILSCKEQAEQGADANRVRMLKEKYSPAAINYFYETVFHEDESEKKHDVVQKWQSDPQIVLTGNPSAEEVGYVKDAISKINKLNLPIKCKMAAQADSSVMEIFFGDFENTGAYPRAEATIGDNADPRRHLGIGRSISYDGIISGSHIGIFYNKQDTIQSIRKNLVLEEMIQSLGVIGDSYTYPGSLFFQNYNPSKNFNQLDSQVLSLLYESTIPANYSRKSFEKTFRDQLYFVNAEEKIKNLLLKSPEEFLEGDELEACFTKNELLKHPKEVAVHLKGSTQQQDYATFQKAAVSINKISPNLVVKIARPDDVEADYGIVVNLKRMETQEAAINLTMEVLKGNVCMFPKLIKTQVSLSFNTSKNARKFRQQSLVDALYFSLIQLPKGRLKGNRLADIGQDSIRFGKHYESLLKLIYSDELTDGLRLSDFKKIKSSVVK
jgi:hypothetical protein